jgi:hypothetical protein
MQGRQAAGGVQPALPGLEDGPARGHRIVVDEGSGPVSGVSELRRIAVCLVSSGLLILAAATVATAPDDRDDPQPPREARLTALVPAYFYPAGPRLTDWGRLAEAARSIPLDVILNPASGPGRRRDGNYSAVVARLRRSGARIMAYVDSDYGRRPLDVVEADLRAYRRFYPIDGYFIDQMANTPGAVDYYRSLRRLIREINPRLSVVGNPGTPYTRPEYLDAADTLVTFEGSARTFASYDPAAVSPWIAGEARGRSAAIVYGATGAAAVRDALERALETGSGSVYVTDQTMPNPYLGLPPYWAELVAAIRAANAPAETAGVASPRPGPS